MKSIIIIDFLVENGELVDEELVEKVDKILKISNPDVMKENLSLFFKSHFPSIKPGPFLNKLFPEPDSPARISIIKSYEKSPSKRSVQDFVRHFCVRFKFLEGLLKNRTELSGLTSISRVRGKNDKDSISVIGMILEKKETKNGHIILTIEDLSGSIKVLINKNNNDLIKLGKDLSLDEVIGIVGVAGGDIIFSNSIIFPDIPLSKELKKSPFDHYAMFLGDMHFGSKAFLKKEFYRFLLWLNGKLGTLEQRKIAKKVKYIFFLGDLIEGVGIYPNQEEDLEIGNVRDQYAGLAEYLKKIPEHIKIIVCPGNHDVGRIAEPQLPIDREYAQSLWDLPNIIMVSNPATLSIDVANNFSGIDVLIYHGYSLIYYSDAISSIRSAGGQKVADDIMIYLLKRRHLAPTHGSSLYVPDALEDGLIIDPIPDIFVTGHIHRAQSKNYRNVTCINSSCWTEITSDQEKRGLEPQPGRAFAVSLKTREIKIMNFGSGKDAKSVSELQE